ncbi:MAG: AraC family transcriptional regulator [Proteobacteria bacterium]|nr:AraC family transcriptional regulator [Pseudomonadota bacterium]
MVTQTLRGETMRAGPLMALPEIMSGFGIAFDSILAEVGLRRDLFATPDNVLAVADAGRLLELCAERAHCPHLGLLVGQAVTPANLGLPGLLMESSATLGAALKSLVLTLHFNGRAAIIALSTRGDAASFSIAIAPGVALGRSIGRDLSLAVACQLIRSLVGRDWTPSDVWLARHAPADRRPYKQCFGVEPRFDTEASALLFPAAWLERPIATANRETRRQIERILSRRASTDAEFVLFCRRAIVAAIVQQNFSVDTVAGLLKLHRRTLNRRLAALGTSVPAQLKDIRFAFAREFLTDTSLSVAEIAAALGYSETATFSRTFRSWAGQSPSDWRRAAESRTAAAVGQGQGEGQG